MTLKNLSFYLAIACSIVSQIFIVLDIGNPNMLKAIWVLPFAIFLLSTPKSYSSPDLRPYYLFFILFAFYLLLCESIFGNRYFGPDFNNICISFSILAISYAFSRTQENDTFLKWIAIISLGSGFVYAYIVYANFLRGSDMFSMIYAFHQKNSAGQIILSCSIIGSLLYTPSRKITKLIYWGTIAFNTFIIFYMKSRATLVGFFFVIAYFAFCYKDKRVRWAFILMTLAAILYIFLNDNAYHVVVDGILLANRDTTDLNELSSNRVEQFNHCVEMINDKPFFGNGVHYFDCFPVSVVVQFGFIGAFIMFFFIRYILKFCFYRIDHSDKVDIVAFLLMLSFLLNSLFEAQPPFGPGVKCFLLWVVWGIMLARKQREYSRIS